jgi:hypothetical protein
MPPRAAANLREIYACALVYAHDKRLPPDAPRQVFRGRVGQPITANLRRIGLNAVTIQGSMGEGRVAPTGAARCPP